MSGLEREEEEDGKAEGVNDFFFKTRELMTFTALDYLFLEVDKMTACVLLTIRSN